MTPVPSDLLATLRAFPDAADAAAAAGLHELEAAYRMALLLFMDACLQDGIDLDPADIGADFGVIDDL